MRTLYIYIFYRENKYRGTHEVINDIEKWLPTYIVFGGTVLELSPFRRRILKGHQMS